MILAQVRDAAQIAGFLRANLAQAMFPLSNLLWRGMAGGHPHAMTFWLRRDDGGGLTDLLGLTDGGMAMPLCPSHDWAAAAKALRGRSISGAIGAPDQVRVILAAVGSGDVARSHDADEALFALKLTQLQVPEGPGALVPFGAAPRPVIIGWLADYLTKTLGERPEQAMIHAIERFDGYATAGSHAVLMDGDTPLAMTGFNADVGDAIQVGGVYTPPALRGNGHAGRAVALHLAQVRARGVTQAVLFTGNPAAAAAYRRIGFAPVGSLALILLHDAQVAHG